MAVIWDSDKEERPMKKRLRKATVQVSTKPLTTARSFTPEGYREGTLLGVEFGFRCAEKGFNLEQTLSRARAILFEPIQEAKK